MPQTEEAIQHAKGADAPIIVAINKMDTQGADAREVLEANIITPPDALTSDFTKTRAEGIKTGWLNPYLIA